MLLAPSRHGGGLAWCSMSQAAQAPAGGAKQSKQQLLRLLRRTIENILVVHALLKASGTDSRRKIANALIQQSKCACSLSAGTHPPRVVRPSDRQCRQQRPTTSRGCKNSTGTPQSSSSTHRAGHERRRHPPRLRIRPFRGPQDAHVRHAERLERVQLREEAAAVAERAPAPQVHSVPVGGGVGRRRTEDTFASGAAGAEGWAFFAPEVRAQKVPRGVVVLGRELRALDAHEAPRGISTWARRATGPAGRSGCKTDRVAAGSRMQQEQEAAATFCGAKSCGCGQQEEGGRGGGS